MVKPISHLLIGLLSLSFPTSAQNRLNGRILDRHGDSLTGAAVCWAHHPETGTVSRLNGIFSLNFNPDDCRSDSLSVSFVGFRSLRIPFRDIGAEMLTGEDTMTLVLQEDPFLLSDIILENDPAISEEFSLVKLEKLEIYLSSASDGDPLKAAGFLPAASGTGESANLELRGSSSQASQVTLNGIALSNPVRNTEISGMGNFSLFNTEIIGDMTVYAGNPPLNQGNCLAGMAELHTVGRVESSQTQVALSMANMGALHTQRFRDKRFVQVYANHQFSKHYLELNQLNGMLGDFGSDDLGVNCHWGDIPIGKGGKLGLMTVQAYHYNIFEDYEGSHYDKGRLQSSRLEQKRQFDIGNLSWKRQRFSAGLDAGWDMREGQTAFGQRSSEFSDRSLKMRFHLKTFLNDDWWVEWGAAYENRTQPFVTEEPKWWFDRRDTAETVRSDSCLHLVWPEAYLYTRYDAGPFVLGLGLRKGFSNSLHQTFLSAQANLLWKLGTGQSVLVSSGRYHGYQLISNGMPRFDFQSSEQSEIGYRYHGDRLTCSAAIYGKKEKGFQDLAYSDTAVQAERIFKGWEVSAKWQEDSWNAGLSFSRIRSSIRMDSLRRGDNDLPYLVKATAGHSAGEGLTLSCTAIFRAGNVFTPYLGSVFDESSGLMRPVAGPHNSQRLGHYSRVNLQINKVIFTDKGQMWVFFATLSNLFNHANEEGVIYSSGYRSLGRYSGQAYSIYGGFQASFQGDRFRRKR